jgi:hypothetical protein
MKSSFCVFAFWGIVSAMVMTGCQTTDENDAGPGPAELVLSISFGKTTYELGEEVFSTMVLRNDGEQAILVNKRLACNTKWSPSPFREISLRVVTPSGEELDFRAKINRGRPKPEDFVELQPGESVQGVCQISWYYHLDQEGTYSVQAFYESQSDPKPGDTLAWKGQLESNVVTFNVIASD